MEGINLLRCVLFAIIISMIFAEHEEFSTYNQNGVYYRNEARLIELKNDLGENFIVCGSIAEREYECNSFEGHGDNLFFRVPIGKT